MRFAPGAGVGDLFGMPFALRLLDFEVRQNSFARASLACELIPPIIEKPLGLLLGIAADGSFTAEVRASDLLPAEADDALIHLRQDGLLDLTVSSVRFELADESTDGAFESVPNAGHFLQQEQPAVVNDALAALLAKVGGE